MATILGRVRRAGMKLLRSWALKYVFVPDKANMVGSGLTGVYRGDWGITNGMEDMTASTWVYACIKAKARAIGSLPWMAYQRMPDDSLVELPNHPLTYLLKHPCPWLSSQEIMERLAMQLDLAGNAILLKSRTTDKKAVGMLWPINPDTITPIADDEKFISVYRVLPQYQSASKYKEFPAEDIIHVRHADPSNLYWGLSPMRAARLTIETEISAVTWNKNALDNRAVSDGILSFKHTLDDDQWTRANELMAAQHQGADYARKPFIIGDDVTYTPTTISPIDMDFIQGRRMTREEICAIFGTPPQVVGIMDQSTYNNMEQAHAFFWLNTILPLADLIADALTTSLASEFGEDLVVDYQTSGIQALSYFTQGRVSTAKTLYDMGVPFNVASRALFLGVPDVPGGDTGWVNPSLMPVEVALEMGGNTESVVSGGAPSPGTPTGGVPGNTVDGNPPVSGTGAGGVPKSRQRRGRGGRVPRM
jgi:HK97 family phage portal protein